MCTIFMKSQSHEVCSVATWNWLLGIPVYSGNVILSYGPSEQLSFPLLFPCVLVIYCLVTTNSAAGNNMCLLSHSLHRSGVQAQCNWCSAQGLIKLKSRHQSRQISFETRILSQAFKFSKLSKNSVTCDCRTEVPFPYWLSVGHHSQLLEAI